MISPSSPSDPLARCVGSASASASIGASDHPQGPSESSASVRSPTPLGTDALSEPSDEQPTSASETDERTNHFNPGTVWLITPRTAPAWTAALDLLDDNRAHDLLDLRQVMLDASDLAPRTINNHLRSATRRGWISTRRGTVRLRDRQLVEAALDAMDGVRS